MAAFIWSRIGNTRYRVGNCHLSPWNGKEVFILHSDPNREHNTVTDEVINETKSKSGGDPVERNTNVR